MALNVVSSDRLSTNVKTSNLATDLSEKVGQNKNLIINGAMNVDQRGVSTEVTPSHEQYLTDRWQVHRSQASKVKFQQVTESPADFKNSIKITSLSAYTSLAADYFAFNQFIEGQNIAHLGWGAAGAKTVTLSFWVRGSVTGNYAVSLRNSAWNRGNVGSYTISSADTWEKKSVTFTGDTTGTWLTTNAAGIAVGFDLGFGSDYVATTGSWNATNDATFSGATKLVATNAATLYITGVQLEVGSTATDFEYRSYGDELYRCQRYYEQFNSEGQAEAMFSAGYFESETVHKSLLTYVDKRAAPTITFSAANSFSVINTGAMPAGSSIGTIKLMKKAASLTITLSTSISGSDGDAGVLSQVGAGSGTPEATIKVDAEL